MHLNFVLYAVAQLFQIWLFNLHEMFRRELCLLDLLLFVQYTIMLLLSALLITMFFLFFKEDKASLSSFDTIPLAFNLVLTMYFSGALHCVLLFGFFLFCFRRKSQ